MKRLLLVLLFVLCGVARASAAISFIDNANGVLSGSTCTTGTYLTGSSTMMVGIVAWNHATVTLNSITQAGSTSLTSQVATTNGNWHVALWSQPATGNTDVAAALVATFSAAPTNAVCVGLKYAGVVALGLTSPNTGSGANPVTTAIVTQDANNWIVAGFNVDDSVTATGAAIRDQTAIGSVDGVGADSGAIASPASTTVGITHNAQIWSAVGLELRTASGGGGAACTPTLTLLGVGRC